jgi:YD repeat-containing protein
VRSVDLVEGSYRISTKTYVWKDGQQDGSLVSCSQTSTDGLQSWHTVWTVAGDDSTAATTYTVTTYDRPNHSRTTTVTQPDGTRTVSVYQFGRLVSVTRYATDNTIITQTTYHYDPHGRQDAVTDLRNAATTYAYNNADLVTSVTTPPLAPVCQPKPR